MRKRFALAFPWSTQCGFPCRKESLLGPGEGALDSGLGMASYLLSQRCLCIKRAASTPRLEAVAGFDEETLSSINESIKIW